MRKLHHSFLIIFVIEFVLFIFPSCDATLKEDINVKQGTTDIPNGTGTYDFGIVAVNSSSSPIIFT